MVRVTLYKAKYKFGERQSRLIFRGIMMGDTTPLVILQAVIKCYEGIVSI